MSNTTYIEAIDSLTEGFCRLKGIGSVNPSDQSAVSIQFEEWEWEVGVGLYGFWHYARYTGNSSLINALGQWYEWQIERGLPEPQINTTAPMIALTLLAEYQGRQEWMGIIEGWADRLMAVIPRTEEGGFQHVVKERPNTGQLWDDTLFMTGLFLAKAGVLLGRDDLVKEAERQFLVHARFLADTKTGLWYHGWTFEGRHNFAEAFWARGNAWVTVAIPELLSLVPDQISPAIKDYLAGVLQSQAKALTSLQADSGMWHTLLDDSESPVESSAVAGIAYGLLKGYRMGLLDDGAKQAGLKAVKAVLSCINDDGILMYASDGTAMGHDLQYYHDIPATPVPYGQALAMMLMTEVVQGEWFAELQ